MLAACAAPGDVRRDGVRYQIPLTSQFHEAARCLAMSFEAINPWNRASHRIRQDGTAEVIGYEFERTVLVAEVVRAGQGSTATIWIARSNALNEPAERDRMMRGC